MKSRLPILCSAALAALTLVPALRGADLDSAPLQPGVRLLEAALLPSQMTLLNAKCEPLIIAVGKTTLEHPGDALSILRAALTRGVVKKKTHGEGQAELLLPCACARRVFLASVAASPKRASDILDLATLLYPDCGREFAGALQAYGDFDDALPAGSGFGVGFGPGFPGAPGFGGGAPSGTTALPPGALTSVVNG